MKTSAELKRTHRKKMREMGYVLKQVWVMPKRWDAVKAIIKAENRISVL